MKNFKRSLSLLLSLALVLGAVAVGGMSVSAALSGSGTPADPYQISSYADLKEFVDIVNGTGEYEGRANSSAYAVLNTNIDATGYNDWVPIAKDSDHAFTGTFDGRGFNIDGLGISRAADKNNIGLFGYIGEGGSVKDVNLISADFNSYDGYYYNGSNFGGIAHENNGSISGCSFDGAIACIGAAGGIACDNYGTIKDCYSNGNVSGDMPVGGIAGVNYAGTITNCYNTASINGDINGTGFSNAGGIAGSNNGTITNCYNTGDVTGSYNVGGIAGSNMNNGKTTDCYNTGRITGRQCVGGVAGYMNISNSSQNCTLTNCYNTGSVTLSGDNAQYSGGVLGALASGTVENCYYDNEKCDCEKAFGYGDNADSVKGLTTAQMTGDNALNNMTFSYAQGETNPWLTKANDENYLYCPHLKGFNLDDSGNQISAGNIEPEDWPAKIEKTNPEMELAATDADYGKTATVTANLPSDAVSSDVTFYLDGDVTGKSVSVSEGKAVCEYTGLTIGEHTVKAVFSGDGCYKGVTDSITFNVNSVDCALTINYQYEDGTEAAKTYNGSVEIFRDYSVTSPEIPNYTPDPATVEGTMGDEDMDGKTVTVTYTANEYSITYVIDGNETVVKYKFGETVVKPADPVKDGYKFTGWDKEIPETMPAENLTITAEFEEIPTPTEPTPTEPTPTEPTPTEPTPTEPTPTEPTPTEPTPTEPTPTEPTPTEPTPTEPTPTEPTPTEPTPTEPTPTEPTPTEPTPTEPTPTEPTSTEPTPTKPTPTEPTSTEPEPAHEHSYKEEVTTKPTCTEDGVMTYTCECGESYTKAIPKTGHTPGEWTVVTPATTEAAGKEVRKCTVCEEVLSEREIAKLEPEETDAGIVSVNLEKTNAFGIANAFGVDPEKLPAGSTVTWYVNGEKAGEGNGFRVANPTEDYTIKAVVTNRDGKVIGETEEVTVKVNNSFFARLYYWLCRIIQKVIDLFKK